MKKCFFASVMACAMVLSGCGEVTILSEPTEPVITDNETILPKNVMQIGETFEVYPDVADGHFLCTVTDVRVVSEESQCPPKEEMDGYPACAFVDGEERIFEYEEWFTEGGAWDHGVRMILVDLTVTNVDAVAWLDDGTFTSSCGYYFHDYAFPYNAFVYLMNLSRVYGDSRNHYYHSVEEVYFSRRGEYVAAAELTEEQIADSLNDDYYAIMAKPGETVSFTIGYIIHGEKDGKPADLSLRWLCIPGREHFNSVNDGIFIDTKLENEA